MISILKNRLLGNIFQSIFLGNCLAIFFKILGKEKRIEKNKKKRVKRSSHWIESATENKVQIFTVKTSSP